MVSLFHKIIHNFVPNLWTLKFQYATIKHINDIGGIIMSNYRGSIARLNGCKMFCGSLIKLFTMNAHAEEVTPTGDNTPPKQEINYEDLIAKARADEKRKHQGTIDTLRSQVATLTEKNNASLLRIAELESDTSSKALRDTIERLTAEKKSLEAELKDFKKNTVDRDTIVAEVRAELEAEYEVKAYRAEQIAAKGDAILVPEFVKGNTKEEIDASIADAITRSEAIRTKITGSTPASPARTPKAPNPSVSSVQDGQYSLEYLATLDVRSPEYAQVRKSLGLR